MFHIEFSLAKVCRQTTQMMLLCLYDTREDENVDINRDWQGS